MEKEKQIYSVEYFTQQSDFVDWVRNGAHSARWKYFLKDHPDQLTNIETARKIVESLSFKKETIGKDDVFTIWERVEDYYSARHITSSRAGIKRILKYAAIIVFAVLAGTYLLVGYISEKQLEFAPVSLSVNNGNEAKLIFADGDEILLKEKKSELQFNKEGNKIKIDQDSIVKTPKEPGKNTFMQIVIPYGKSSVVHLSDGTTVCINAGSKLMFPQTFQGKERKVFLTGEAYFEVEKDKKHPFVVSTNNINVTVLGTQFNVRDNVSEDELEVVLVEGEVSLKESNVLSTLRGEYKLTPNQKAVYSKQANSTRIESDIDTRYYTSWKDGLLMFKRESIVSVFLRLSKYYNVEFVSDKKVELNSSFTGKLDITRSLEDVLNVVSDVAPIKFRIENNKVYITQKSSFLPM